MTHPIDIGDTFNRETNGLAAASPTTIIDLADGAHYALVAAPVRKHIGSAEVRLLAYNGSVPGPTLRVRQGSSISVTLTNQSDLESTVHWHGLRLENRYDGTHETQAPTPVGGQFTYRVQFPDPGVYWYHPHVREDYGQELGLYGTVLVTPADRDYWSPVHREVALTVDDILIEDELVAAFSQSETTYAAMGRFGNVLLANGESDLSLSAMVGEVVRYYLTNTANARVFNIVFTGAHMKLVGGDSGRFEREVFVESVLLAPSERVVVDVLFDTPGQATIEHRSPRRTAVLATIAVSDEPVRPALAQDFELLRSNAELVAERQQLTAYLAAAPDKTLAFVAEMHLGVPETAGGTLTYGCPMHPEVSSPKPGRCPRCGMTLLAIAIPAAAWTYSCPMHQEVVSDAPGKCPTCGMALLPKEPSAVVVDGAAHQTPAEPDGATHGQHTADGIEWEDDMEAINRVTTAANTRWKLVDRATGVANHAIDWCFRVGERVKIRLVNELDSDHPMQHPFHIHGAGRFLVLSRDGVVEPNLVWKDTVLVRTGETVDILLDVTNPGTWMAHCHIAEHHENGMMFSFQVSE